MADQANGSGQHGYLVVLLVAMVLLVAGGAGLTFVLLGHKSDGLLRDRRASKDTSKKTERTVLPMPRLAPEDPPEVVAITKMPREDLPVLRMPRVAADLRMPRGSDEEAEVAVPKLPVLRFPREVKDAPKADLPFPREEK